jgi:nucleotide-binding universal stress UspA family protein
VSPFRAVVRDTRLVPTTEPQRIVVGVDGSAASDAALAWGCDEGRLRGATVVALHVVVIPYELPRIPVEVPESELEREGAQLLDDAVARAPTDGVAIEPQLLEGTPGELLVEASQDAALVVVGTRAHGRLATFVIGSVSDTAVHHAKCPVVVVRG